METLVSKILFLLGNLDYSSVFLLMTLESSFIPFPSEVIVPPAAYLASRGELNLFLVILVGSLGSLVGAIINYFIAYFLGRPLVYRIADHKFSRMLLISSSKVEKAEDFFLRYGGLSTFIGRLVPGVRQLISLPAGFSRMNFKEFCFYTVLGAGLWVAILAILGYFFGANQDLLHQFAREISNTFLVLALLVLLFMLFYKREKKQSRVKESN